MIGIASSATPQPDSLFREPFERTAGVRPKTPGRLARTRPPRKTSSHRRRGTPLGYAPSVEIAFDGHRDHPPTAADDSQIPIAPAGGYPPFRLAVSFFGGFRTPAPVPRDGKRPGRAGIRNPSHFLPFIASDRMSAPEAPSRLSEGRAIAPVLPRCCATNYDGRHPALACRYKSLRSSPPCRQHAYSGA